MLFLQSVEEHHVTSLNNAEYHLTYFDDSSDTSEFFRSDTFVISNFHRPLDALIVRNALRHLYRIAQRAFALIYFAVLYKDNVANFHGDVDLIADSESKLVGVEWLVALIELYRTHDSRDIEQKYMESKELKIAFYGHVSKVDINSISK